VQSPASSSGKTVFQEFLLAEYDNIAEAHHNTVKSISEFFKHYILIMSLPITAAVLVLKPSDTVVMDIEHIFLDRPEVIPLFTGFVMLLGLTVLGYVSNLRCDALLYARAVNGIRRYFSDLSELPVGGYANILALPRSTHVPPYHEPAIFGFVVGTFSLFGTGYFWAGLYLYYRIKVWPMDWLFHIFVPGFLLATHYCVYYLVTRMRRKGLSSSPIIGIDIDGVLNDHRLQFTQVLSERLSKRLDPAQINVIPVHEIEGAGITIDDEEAVFNWPKYWTDMPVLNGASDATKKFRRLGYKIFVFTYRPWPRIDKFSDQANKKAYWVAWNHESWLATPFYWKLMSTLENVLGKREFLTSRIIRKVTINWLGANQIEYDHLVVERANVYTADPWAHAKNRFLDSIRLNARFFVEDDLYKAIKLAYICEVVFLMNHPYNQKNASELPPNIIRVESWKDIYSFIKRQ
jgi:uncharacterized HAD superfamily protein